MKKIAKQIGLLFLFLFMLMIGYSQNQMKQWNIAPYYHDFTSPVSPVPPLPTIPGGYQGTSPNQFFNAWNYSTGALDYFIVDGNIYDNTGALLSDVFNFINTTTLFSAQMYLPLYYHSTELPIFQDPISPEISHIVFPGFIASVFACNNNVSYELIPGFNPVFAIPQIHPYARYNTFSAVTKKLPSGNQLLFILDGQSFLRVYEISSGNTNYLVEIANVDLSLEVNDYKPQPIAGSSEMECYVNNSNGSFKVAFPLSIRNTAYSCSGTAPFRDKLCVFNFDSYSNFYTNTANPGTINFQNHNEYEDGENNFTINACDAKKNCIKGIEFSPDGSKLFYTEVFRNDADNVLRNHSIYFVDFNAAGAVVPLTQFVSIPSEIDFNYGMIEKGYNSNNATNGPSQSLYFIAGDRLAYLENPDDVNSYVWHDNAVTFSSPRAKQQVWPGNYDNTEHFVYCLPDQIDDQDYDIMLGVLTYSNLNSISRLYAK